MDLQLMFIKVVIHLGIRLRVVVLVLHDRKIGGSRISGFGV